MGPVTLYYVVACALEGTGEGMFNTTGPKLKSSLDCPVDLVISRAAIVVS